MRLIDADALKEELAYKSPATGFDTDSVILGVIDEQPTVSPWHKVEEELPEIGKSVVVSIYGDMLVATRLDDKRFNGRMYWELSDGSWEQVEKDMYWMPLPEPPKEDA